MLHWILTFTAYSLFKWWLMNVLRAKSLSRLPSDKATTRGDISWPGAVPGGTVAHPARAPFISWRYFLLVTIWLLSRCNMAYTLAAIFFIAGSILVHRFCIFSFSSYSYVPGSHKKSTNTTHNCYPLVFGAPVGGEAVRFTQRPDPWWQKN